MVIYIRSKPQNPKSRILLQNPHSKSKTKPPISPQTWKQHETNIWYHNGGDIMILGFRCLGIIWLLKPERRQVLHSFSWSQSAEAAHSFWTMSWCVASMDTAVKAYASHQPCCAIFGPCRSRGSKSGSGGSGDLLNPQASTQPPFTSTCQNATSCY